MPRAETWEKDLRPLARADKENFDEIIQRPLKGYPRRFVMNQAASGCDTSLLNNHEDFILLFENPDKGKNAPLNSSAFLSDTSGIPDNGCKVTAFFMDSAETVCGPGVGRFGPCLHKSQWNGYIKKSDAVTKLLKFRQYQQKLGNYKPPKDSRGPDHMIIIQ